MLHLSELQVKEFSSRAITRVWGGTLSLFEGAMYILVGIIAAFICRPLITLKWAAICLGLMIAIILVGWISGGFSLSPYSSFAN